MHIPQHTLDPTTCALTGAVSAAAVGYALFRMRNESVSRKLPLMTMVGASIFAAQSLNFPISPGTSGHLLGGALAAILLGPWAGMVVVAAVVALQCLLLSDGGLLALGANVFNMAIIGCLVGHAIYAQAARLAPGRRAAIVSAAVAAACSVLASTIVCSLELSLGAGYPLASTLAAMLSAHGLTAMAEMLITGAIVALALEPVAKCTWRRTAIGLACAAVAAIAISPFVTRLPDGLETVMAQSTIEAAHR